jgi:hypothetical protein
MTVRLVDPQGTILAECADRRMTRDDVALSYAFALRQTRAGEDEVDWRVVNDAIIERWSLSALKYIKEAAWRRLRG